MQDETTELFRDAPVPKAVINNVVPSIISNIIRAEGKANVAMAGMLIGNLINIVLDPVMILGLGWNVAGAAIATFL